MGTLSSFRFIDLFAGIGGFHHALGAREFGGECVLASEIDDYCRLVYRTQWPMMDAHQLVGDIRGITQAQDGATLDPKALKSAIPDHEVLCAGFPCQPFSKSGPQLGMRDPDRGRLFFNVALIIEAKRPKFVILENVPNLAGPRHRETWSSIVATLRGLGYRVCDEPLLLSPHDLPPEQGGRPQTRKRIFIVATRVDDAGSLDCQPLFGGRPFPDWDSGNWNLESILQPDDDIANLRDYLLRPDEVAWIDAWQSFVEGLGDREVPTFPIWVDAFGSISTDHDGAPEWKQRFRRLNRELYRSHRPFIDSWLERSWRTDSTYRVRDFPPSRRKFEWQARQAQVSIEDRDLWRLLIQFRPSGIRVKPATYTPALVAMNQTPIVGSRRRRLTPLETARLQGLPDNIFADAQVPDSIAYRQAGNSVNVGVAQFVAAQLFRSEGYDWGRELLRAWMSVTRAALEARTQ